MAPHSGALPGNYWPELPPADHLAPVGGALVNELRAACGDTTVPLSVIATDRACHPCRDCKTLILAAEPHIHLPQGRYHITCIIRILEALK